MSKKKIAFKELLKLIPEECLDEISKATKVNYQVKKLTGKKLFKLLLYGLLSQKELSWRILENIFQHYKFQYYSGIDKSERTDHSSLATRVSKIKVEFFEEIYLKLNEEIAKNYSTPKIGGYEIVRFDSTLVSIAGSLLQNVKQVDNQVDGLRHGIPNKYRTTSSPVDVKFTIGFNGLNSVKASLFDKQTYLSEEVALKEVMQDYAFKTNDLAVFDRGLNKRDTLDAFTDKSVAFVTRMRAPRGKIRYELVNTITSIDKENPLETDKLIVEQDIEVYLFNKKQKRSKHTYRFIKARSKELGKNGLPIYYYFLTNEKKLSVEQILLIYKVRWDIEVFFKFLKQEFGFKHFLSRNKNGIEVMLYMTLIAFNLIFIYYKINEFDSFKIAKMQFVNELELEILKTIITLCNGDPQLLHLMNTFKGL